MLAAAVSLRAKHEVDRFEYIPKVSKDPTVTRPEWRIRCNDCPGKVRFFFLNPFFTYCKNSLLTFVNSSFITSDLTKL